jgi:hypothetical protein
MSATAIFHPPAGRLYPRAKATEYFELGTETTRHEVPKFLS